MDTNLSSQLFVIMLITIVIYQLLSLIFRYCHVITLFYVVSARLINPVVIWNY